MTKFDDPPGTAKVKEGPIGTHALVGKVRCATWCGGDPRPVQVVTSSEIARLLALEPVGNEESRTFGKVFEEEFTMATYLRERGSLPRELRQRFVDSFSVHLKREGLYTKDRVRSASEMYTCLLKAGAKGHKPRTLFRELRDGVYIAAQPDLEWGPTEGAVLHYFEFKLYPLNEYARAQTRVFSWVLGVPLTLIGLRPDGPGYLAETQVISGEGFQPPVPDVSMGMVQEFCERHDFPVGRCPRATLQ